MKKLVLGLLATFLVTAGLVGFTGTTAQAGPYTGTVKTSTICKAANVKVGQNGVIRVRVAANGNTAPRGRVTIRVVKNVGNFRFVNSKAYTGGVAVFRTPKLRKIGKYTVNCKFDRKANSVWRDSNNVDTFLVMRRR